jgi:hypothetical protein
VEVAMGRAAVVSPLKQEYNEDEEDDDDDYDEVGNNGDDSCAAAVRSMSIIAARRVNRGEGVAAARGAPSTVSSTTSSTRKKKKAKLFDPNTSLSEVISALSDTGGIVSGSGSKRRKTLSAEIPSSTDLKKATGSHRTDGTRTVGRIKVPDHRLLQVTQ